MKTQALFLILVLCLTLGLSWTFRAFENHYSDRHELVDNLKSMKASVERKELQKDLLENQIEDLQAQVFKHLGEKKLADWGDRQWMNSLRSPASVPSLEIQSDRLMATAKKHFAGQNYHETILALKEVIQKYPASKDIIEAHFLMAESLYVSGQTESCLDMVDQMMQRYPESELTGFIMLRMGQILEKKKRKSEADEVYQAIIRGFPASADLRAQAEKMLGAQ